MLSDEERKQIAAEAKERADRGGLRPQVDGHNVAALTGVAVLGLLTLFSAVVGVGRDVAEWPAIIMTAIAAAAAWLFQHWRERSWSKRYNQAETEVVERVERQKARR